MAVKVQEGSSTIQYVMKASIKKAYSEENEQ